MPTTRRQLVVAGAALLAVSAGMLAMHGTVVGSAVPEPSIWLMTILGFFAAGSSLRRRRTAAANQRAMA